MLARKVFLASAVLSVGRFAIRFLDLLAALIVARYLTPAEFGMVSLAVAMLVTLRAMTELPISEALIRTEELTQQDIDTAFTLSVIRGLTVAGLLAGAAWPIAQFYDDPRLFDLTLAFAIAPSAMALRSPHLVRFARDLNYLPSTALDIGARMVGFVASLSLILTTGSYWALAIGLLVPPVVAAPISYVIAPYRPRLSLARWRSVLSFAGWFSLARFAATANGEIDRFFIGGVLGKAPIGFFTLGRSIATTVSWAIGIPLLQAMLPGFAKMQSEPDRMRAAYLKGQATLVAALMPLGFGLALVAEPLVAVGLGDQWLPVVPVIQVLAPIGALVTVTMPTHAVVLALGKPKSLAVRDVLIMLFSIPVVILGALGYGLMGAVLARALSSIVQITLDLQILRRTLGLPIVAQLANTWRSFIAVAVMVVTLLTVHALASGHGLGGPMWEIVFATSLGGSVYFATHAVLWWLAGKPRGPERLFAEAMEAVGRRLATTAGAKTLT